MMIERRSDHKCEVEVPISGLSINASDTGVYMDASMCLKSDLPELQFQLMVVFTGKSIAQSRCLE